MVANRSSVLKAGRTMLFAIDSAALPAPADLAAAARRIALSRRTIALTGAGMSTESGVPDFRSERGLFSVMPEEALSLHYFLEQTDDFYAFVRRHFLVAGVEPNDGHLVLASWERRGLVDHIVTQNIDGLHQAAGSRHVLELHGSSRTATCQRCGRRRRLGDVCKDDPPAYVCRCGGLLKPDIVLYDEPVTRFPEACRLVADADLLLVLGTSLSVMPAAELPALLPPGAGLIVVNLTPAPADARPGALVLHGPIGPTLTRIDALLRARA